VVQRPSEEKQFFSYVAEWQRQRRTFEHLVTSTLTSCCPPVPRPMYDDPWHEPVPADLNFMNGSLVGSDCTSVNFRHGASVLIFCNPWRTRLREVASGKEIPHLMQKCGYCFLSDCDLAQRTSKMCALQLSHRNTAGKCTSPESTITNFLTRDPAAKSVSKSRSFSD